MSTVNTCSVCSKTEDERTPIMRCSGCSTRLYCGVDCQRVDWPTHKSTCKNAPAWYNKYRKCDDGKRHEGRLELITWDCPKEGTGWGHVVREEAEMMRRKFETKYGSDPERFFRYWPQGFRWTCCGTDAGMHFGCDHHGSGSTACTCDFCRMGKPLPDKIYNEQSASRMGLKLRRGPDPRSFHAGLAALAATNRTMMGLEM